MSCRGPPGSGGARSEDTLDDGQQRGALIASSGRISRHPGPVSEFAAGGQGVGVLGTGDTARRYVRRVTARGRQRRFYRVSLEVGLAALGRAGVSRLVAGHVALARRFASALSAGGLEVLNEVWLNQVVTACADDAATGAMIAAVQREGTCWCGPTTWCGRRAMRISISNWATTEADVDRSAAAVLAPPWWPPAAWAPPCWPPPGAGCR